jgi:hypothetical protein
MSGEYVGSKPTPHPTPLHGSTTIALNDLQAGQTLYLSVGDTFTLDNSITGHIQIGNEHIVKQISAASASERSTYKALASGRTELRVSQELPCARANPPCLAPASVLTLIIEVQEHR